MLPSLTLAIASLAFAPTTESRDVRVTITNADGVAVEQVVPIRIRRLGDALQGFEPATAPAPQLLGPGCTNFYTNSTASGSGHLPGAGCQIIDYGCTTGGLVCEFDFGYSSLAEPGVVAIAFIQNTSNSVCPGTLVRSYGVQNLPGLGSYVVTVSLTGTNQFILPSGNFGYGYTFDNSSTYALLASGGTCTSNRFWDCFCSIVTFGGSPYAGLYMRVAKTNCTAASISSHPSSPTVCAGSNAGLTVTAAGTSPTYQWRRGTTNVVNGGNIFGATTATLSFNPAFVTNAASDYNCVVSTACGSATSNNATLTVNAPVSFSAHPNTTVACTSGTAMLSVAASAAPAPTYRWRRGTTNLNNTGGYSGVTTPTLTVSPVTLALEAPDYNCLVTNTCGSVASNNASLIVFAGGSADPNFDTLRNGLDIQIFSALLIAGGSPSPLYCAADMNADGLVNAADVAPFVAAILAP